MDREDAATVAAFERGVASDYTVAQFAQAIGAVHYANYRRNVARAGRQDRVAVTAEVV
jgi:hypothetical protein